MGCVSSDLFHQTPNPSGGAAAAFSHHIVSLTSSSYGLLSLDHHDHPPRFTFGSIFPTSLSENPIRSDPEVINSWELMAGLTDAESFRFPTPPIKISENEIRNPKSNLCSSTKKITLTCPPGGEEKVVLYTTSLRGVRKTFEECNAVRSALESIGVLICERDVSMDRGFREELKELTKGAAVPPRLFVRGRYVGGYEEVMRIVEEDSMGEVVEGMPRKKVGEVCEGCGAARFMPCFRCNGSAKIVVKAAKAGRGGDVARCPECNENGLVLCPICS